MVYQNTFIESIAVILPENRVASSTIERMLSPLYQRLNLREGRLELMTGIRERRHWQPGTMPSQKAALAGKKALGLAGLAREQVETMINCSVSRDFVEPATSTIVHRLLELPKHALNFDLSNACLGFLSGMIVLAGLIESGQIKHGLLVAAENGRPLMENTIQTLNRNHQLNRRQIKPMLASLTIGSAAVAAVLCHRSVSRFQHRLLGGTHLCDTQFNYLCQGGTDQGMGEDSRPLMNTDAEELLVQGVRVARQNWQDCKLELGWNNHSPDLVCTHQVGRAHRQRLYQELEINPEKDFATVESMGNCGSASLPATLALALEQKGKIKKGNLIALLGIGSGINCQMLGLEW